MTETSTEPFDAGRVIALALCGAISGFVLAILPAFPMLFIVSAALTLGLLGVVLTTVRLSRLSKAGARAYVFGAVLTLSAVGLLLCVLVKLDEGPRDSMFSVPQHYDGCEELRYLFSCGEQPDGLSRFLTALRCADLSLMSVPTRTLKPGYYNLHQQCFGG